MTQRVNRLSPAGRLRCREAGSRNLAAWRESVPATLDLKSDIEGFEADLREEVGENPSAAQRGLIAGAVATYAAIKLAQRKLLASSRSTRKLNELLSAVPPLVGSLQRSLRMLGVAAGDIEPVEDGPPSNATLEERRAWSKRYVEGVLAGDRSREQ